MSGISWHRRVEYASGYIQLGMLADAEAELAHINPGDAARAEVLSVRCDLYSELKDWPRMVETGRSLAETRPEDPHGWISWAFALRELQRVKEALAVLVPLYLLIFARIYLVNSLADPSGFSRSLDHVSSLYFTVTVFATVGFGDIVATSDAMLLLVTAQMLLNLVVLGLGIRLLTSAARRGIARRGGLPDIGDRDHPLA